MSLVLLYRIFIFVVGATFGVILAHWILNLHNPGSNNYSTLYNPHADLLTDSKQYHHLLQDYGISQVAQDKQSCSKPKYLESDFLRQHVKLTCVIFVSNVKAAYRVYNSWVSKCDNFYFFGPNEDPFVPINTKTHSKYPWQRLCSSLEYLILNERQKLRWLILVNDNTYVIPENLRFSVAFLNSIEPFYGGLVKSHRHILYSSLNAGIVLNVATLEFLLQSNSLPCYLENYFEADYFLGRQLYTHGIHPKRLLDSHMCNRFHTTTLTQTCSGHIQRQLADYDLAENHLLDENKLCFSKTSITFKLPDLQQQEMQESMLDYLMYQFQKTPVCYSPAQDLSPPHHTQQEWARSILMYVNRTEAELLTMSDAEYYTLWTNLTLKLPQTW